MLALTLTDVVAAPFNAPAPCPGYIAAWIPGGLSWKPGSHAGWLSEPS